MEKNQGQWRQPSCSVLAFHDDAEWNYLSLWRCVRFTLTSNQSKAHVYLLCFSQDLLVSRRLAIHPLPPTICISSHGLGVSKLDKQIMNFTAKYSPTPLFIHNTTHISKIGELNWSKVECADENLPPPRYRHSACALDGKLIIFGGYLDGKSRTNDVWQFDPENHTWSNLSPDSSKGVCSSTSIFVLGYKVLTIICIYLVEASTNIPCPRGSHSASVVGNKMYVFGSCSRQYIPDLL